MLRLIVRVGAFGTSMILMIIVGTVAWETLVNNRLYNCTDPGLFDYLSPGQWVHHPVAVHQVVSGRSMSDPDTIKEGWSIARLWYLWDAFFGISIAVSTAVAMIPWIPKQPAKQACHTDS